MDNQAIIKLQTNFKYYLLNQGYSPIEANQLTNDAFYLFYHNLSISFQETLTCEDDLEKKYEQCFYNHFLLSGNEEVAKERTQKYIQALGKLKKYYKDSSENIIETKLVIGDADKDFLVNYCKNMRLHHSYKPVLLLAMLEYANVNGTANLSELANYFVTFYNRRRQQQFAVEQKDSIFSTGEVSQKAAESLIERAPLARLMDDSILLYDNAGHVSFCDRAKYDFANQRDRVKMFCNKRINQYYANLAAKTLDKNLNKVDSYEEQKLGNVLRNMYENAPQGDAAAMLHLFGIRYSEYILSKNLSVRKIVFFSGIKSSYYAEVQKGIHLSRYVKEK